jgi:hypothetical protein
VVDAIGDRRDVVLVAGGHLPGLARPQELAARLLGYQREVAGTPH